jgi:hypothetical protein
MESVDEETGTQLSTRQVIDEVKTFIAAGHETTAHGRRPQPLQEDQSHADQAVEA